METDEDRNLAEQRDTDIGKWRERKQVRRTRVYGAKKRGKGWKIRKKTRNCTGPFDFTTAPLCDTKQEMGGED